MALRKVWLVAAWLALSLSAGVTAQDGKEITPAGSVKVVVPVEVEGVLSVKGPQISVVVREKVLGATLPIAKEEEREWVLDFAAAKELQAQAEKLAGKYVLVRGTCLLRGVNTTTYTYKTQLPIYPPPPPMMHQGSQSQLDLEHRIRVQSLAATDPPKAGGVENPPIKPAPDMAKPAVVGDLLHVVDWAEKSGGTNAMLKKLAAGKVATKKEAVSQAVSYKMKNGGLMATETFAVTGLITSGVDVPDFAAKGDLIWVVRFTNFGGPVTQELWINSETGAIRPVFAGKGK